MYHLSISAILKVQTLIQNCLENIFFQFVCICETILLTNL